MPNIRTVNKLIAAHHPGYSLVQGEGYCYFNGPDTHTWDTSSVGVNRVSDQSPTGWLTDLTYMRHAVQVNLLNFGRAWTTLRSTP